MFHAGLRLGDRYRLDRRVGAGGMGEVWQATDEVLGRVVAVKVMLAAALSETGAAHRFIAEAQAMASVNHPGVAAIHDYQPYGNTAFLVMEFIEGQPLSQWLSHHGPISPQATMRLVGEVAAALQAVHDKGIVHRDVKPGNLLIRSDGRIVLTDFGIARSPGSSSVTTVGAVLGTPSYLAPEQVLGHPASSRSDIYSLGLVAYECLVGRRPFEADNPVAVALQRVHQEPRAVVGDFPRPVLAVVERALAVDPAQRWSSAAELAQAAQSVAEGGDVDGGPASPRRPAVRGVDRAPDHQADHDRLARRTGGGGRGRRTAAVVGAGAGVLLLLIGAGIWAAVVRDRPPGTYPSAAGGDAVGAGGQSPGAQSPGVQSPAVQSSITQIPGGQGGNTNVPAGYVACGDAICTEAPMCWAGMTIIGGVAQKIRRIDCGEPHYWETFAVGHLPVDAIDVAQDELMTRPDIAASCSVDRLARQSLNPNATKGWDREAWPMQLGDGTWLLHCMASPGIGEWTGSRFRSGV